MTTLILAPDVAAKIAAGEVIERPASVVKELVENAIDALATQIKIEVTGGGVSLIRVTDNGLGIVESEVEIVFERHATSKVVTIEDLESIKTLGFRGEALPSIAAVADTTMISRTKEAYHGTCIILRNGVVIEKKQAGSPQGTSITVQNLFKNVPARLKFLKTSNTENNHIINVVSQYSLAFPAIRFVLVIDGKTILSMPGNGRLQDALVELYGMDVAKHMIEIEDNVEEFDESIPRVSGCIAASTVTRSNRNYQSFFINGRWVKNNMLSYALEEAYHGLLMVGRHPIAAINISLPPGEIDVNVHPAKTEVRFRQEGKVFKALQKAVRASLIGSMAVPMVKSSPESGIVIEKPAAMAGQKTEKYDIDSFPDSSKDQSHPLEMGLPVLHVIGQISNMYVIAEGPYGIYLIDQHAAHERILYEQLKSKPDPKSVDVQGLLEPLYMELTPRQERIIQLYIGLLTEYGFTIEPFGDSTYLLRAVPALLREQNIIESLTAILDTVDDHPSDLQETLIESMACHGAIKAGKTLTIEEMKNLIGQLEKAALPYTCPHGRPTMIHFSLTQLQKEFGRK